VTQNAASSGRPADDDNQKFISIHRGISALFVRAVWRMTLGDLVTRPVRYVSEVVDEQGE